MKKIVNLTTLFTVAALLFACSSENSGDDTGSMVNTVPAEAVTTENYTSVNCVELAGQELIDEGIFGSPADKVECGFVRVPEDWGEPDGRQIQIAVYRVPSTSQNPESDPVVYLEGGPGGAGVATLPVFISASEDGDATYLRERSDVIVIDQRGTGYSRPALYCPEVSEAEVSGSDPVAAHRACHDRLVGTGVNLQNYNSAANARDVDAVRKAMGYQQWDLYGLSYGSRLALTVMRDFPDPLRSVVLDSVFPPEVNGISEAPYPYYFAMEQIVRNCVADDDCVANVGDIKPLIENGLARLDANPIVVGDESFNATVYLEILGEEISNADLASLIAAVANASDAELIALLTEMEEELESEEDELPPYHLLPESLYPFVAEVAEMMSLAVICQEETPFPNDRASPEIASNFSETTQRIVDKIVLFDNEQELCDVINLMPAPVIEIQPVVAATSTLILAGTADLQTPPAWSQLSASSLQNAQYAEFAGLTHGLLGADECINTLTQAFLEEPDVVADQSCIAALPSVDYTFD